MSNLVACGSVHGRFQPPHLGHLEYITEAKSLCNFLWIGITQYDLRALKNTSIAEHRSEKQSNPLTYWERVSAISLMLESIGIDKREFGFTPFPIEQPEKIRDFLGEDVVCFTTIYDEWNREKVNILKKLGYDVRILWERQKKDHVGSTIRRKIIENDKSWGDHLEDSVKQYIDSNKIADRIRKLEK